MKKYFVLFLLLAGVSSQSYGAIDSKSDGAIISFEKSIYVTKAQIFSDFDGSIRIIGSVFIANSEGVENIFPITNNSNGLSDQENAFKDFEYDNGFKFKLKLHKKGIYTLRVYYMTTKGEYGVNDYVVIFRNGHYNITPENISSFDAPAIIVKQ